MVIMSLINPAYLFSIYIYNRKVNHRMYFILSKGSFKLLKVTQFMLPSIRAALSTNAVLKSSRGCNRRRSGTYSTCKVFFIIYLSYSGNSYFIATLMGKAVVFVQVAVVLGALW